MTITFENDNDVIVYALEKIVSFARENQYLFVGNCPWWLAEVLGLDRGLTTHIDNLALQRNTDLSVTSLAERNTKRSISSTPRDIAQSVSADPPSEKDVAEGSRKLSRNQRRKLARNKNCNRIQKK